MLHNTGPYGLNESPVNMSVSVNDSELNNPMNLSENLNNMAKMPQESPHPSMKHYNLQHFSSYVGGSVNNSPQIGSIPNYNNLKSRSDIFSQSSVIVPNRLSQNGSLIENFYHNRDLIQTSPVHPLEGKLRDSNPDHYLKEESAPPLKTAPQLSIRNHRFTTVPQVPLFSNHTSTVDYTKSLEKQVDLLTSETKKSTRQKAEDVIMSPIQELEVPVTTSIDNQIDCDIVESKSYLRDLLREKSCILNIPNPQILSTEVKSDIPRASASCSTDKSQLRTVKEEPTRIVSEIIVKVEPILSWTDNDHDQPFHKDINGVSREDCKHRNIVNCINSENEAINMLKNGSNTEVYFECSNCCLLFPHPKRFLIHCKWHKLSLIDVKKLEDKVLRRRQKKEKEDTSEPQSDNGESQDPNSKGVLCKDCDKTFANKTSLRNHRHKFHPNREHECKICHKVCLGWYGLKTHMDTHNLEGAHQCPICPKRFKHAHSLTKHRDTHLEKIHECPECPKKFGSQTLLKMHMRSHERALKGPTFHCTYCAKAFYESYTLQVHERTHRNERPFHCDICNTSYGTNSSLKRHVKVSHTDSTLKPFECETCHRRFVSELIRDRHAAREHDVPGQLAYACTKCTCRYLRLKDLRRHMYRTHPKGKKRRKPSDSE